MRNKTYIFAFTMSCLLVLGGCGHKNYAKFDSSNTETTIAMETMAVTTASPETTTIEETENQQTTPISQITASIHTYQEGNISIQYPVVSGLDDSSLEKKINNQFLNNAIAIIKAYSMDSAKDSLSIECKIISADRKRTTAVYTGIFSPDGAAHPTNIYYTNTIDMSFGEDVGLSDYVDPYTLAGYVLSDDCQYYNADSNVIDAYEQTKKDSTLESYTQMFNQADFPLQKESAEDALPFPECFSYEDKGTIFISLPVSSHALGDYIMIKYTPDTK